LVKYTLLGDTQLRGSVGIGDYNAVLNNYGTAQDWTGGDFHYGGTVGIGDYNNVLNNFGKDISPSLQINLVAGSDTAASPRLSSDLATLNAPSITGSLTNATPVALQAGLDSTASIGYTSILGDVNSDGTFTLTPAQLARINGKTLAAGKHTLHVQELNSKGKVIASRTLNFTVAASKPKKSPALKPARLTHEK